MKLALKRGVGCAYSLIRPHNKGRDIVLLYHSVAGGPLSTPLSSFKAQMDWLAKHASVLPLRDLLNAPNTGGLRVALTFDDGYVTLHDSAMPILRNLNLTATVFLTTGMLQEHHCEASREESGHYPGERFLSWPQVLDLVQAGWSIGSHGWQHLDGTVLTDEHFLANIKVCRNAIKTRTGLDADYLAFTWGRFLDSQLKLADQAGIHRCFSCIHGPIDQAARLGKKAVPRIDVRPDLTLADFIAMVAGDWDYLGLIQKARRRLRKRHA